MGIALSQQEVLDFFFEAGAKTYAGDAVKTTIGALPGSRVLRYLRVPYLYVDVYFSLGEKSFGQIGIWHEALPTGPIWGMQYRGWCKDKRVIPFLKRALLAAYEQRLFVGGRGPRNFRVEGETLAYQNCLRLAPSSFSDSEGEEEIWDPAIGPTALFRHGYNCLALVHFS